MSLNDLEIDLAEVCRRLDRNWQRMYDTWQDTVAVDFERLHVQPLIANVDGAIGELKPLIEVMTKARHSVR